MATILKNKLRRRTASANAGKGRDKESWLMKKLRGIFTIKDLKAHEDETRRQIEGKEKPKLPKKKQQGLKGRY